ncbi:hypothetical protein CGH85_22925 [Vibrio parahaemolyticus]|uniref:hypothetical protein n=1 Tax=Vibrio parahaemolyticus TaxID=670 RepID=UPI001122F208|nr:hypothetical protein [Vibrio parahaemolyticus]TOM03409.1 hypothetical protein CGH85_22925 [Vibrio parahaemolyticus]
MIGDVIFIDTEQVKSSDDVLKAAKDSLKAFLNKRGQDIKGLDVATKKWTHVAMGYGDYSAMHANLEPNHVEQITIDELVHPNSKFRVFRNIALHKQDHTTKKMKLKVFNILNSHIGKAYDFFNAKDAHNDLTPSDSNLNNYVICSTLVAKAIHESGIDSSFIRPRLTFPHDLYIHISKSKFWIDVTDEYLEAFATSYSYSQLYKTPPLYHKLQKELYRIARNNFNRVIRRFESAVEGKEAPLSGLRERVQSNGILAASYRSIEGITKDEINLTKLEYQKYARIFSMLDYDYNFGEVSRESLEQLVISTFDESIWLRQKKNHDYLKKSLSTPFEIGNKWLVLDRSSYTEDQAEMVFLNHSEECEDAIMIEAGAIYVSMPDGSSCIQVRIKDYDDLHPIWVLQYKKH